MIECIDFSGLIIEPCFPPLCSLNNLESAAELILSASISKPNLKNQFIHVLLPCKHYDVLIYEKEGTLKLHIKILKSFKIHYT